MRGQAGLAPGGVSCNPNATVRETALGADQSLELMRSLLWHTMVIAGPVLLAALLTGLAVSVLQVATQLQEMTLSYIPKLLATALVLIALGSWMIHQLTQFAIDAIRLLPTLT